MEAVISGRVMTVEHADGVQVSDAGVMYARPIRPFAADEIMSDAPLTWMIDGHGRLKDGAGSSVITLESGQYRLDFDLRAGWIRSQVVNIPAGGTVEAPQNIARLMGIEGNHPQPWVMTVEDVLRVLSVGDNLGSGAEAARDLLARLAEVGPAVEDAERAETAANASEASAVRAESAVVLAEQSASGISDALALAQASAEDAVTTAGRSETAAGNAEASAGTAETAATSAVSSQSAAETSAGNAETAAGQAAASVTEAESAVARAEAAEQRVRDLLASVEGGGV